MAYKDQALKFFFEERESLKIHIAGKRDLFNHIASLDELVVQDFNKSTNQIFSISPEDASKSIVIINQISQTVKYTISKLVELKANYVKIKIEEKNQFDPLQTNSASTANRVKEEISKTYKPIYESFVNDLRNLSTNLTSGYNSFIDDLQKQEIEEKKKIQKEIEEEKQKELNTLTEVTLEKQQKSLKKRKRTNYWLGWGFFALTIIIVGFLIALTLFNIPFSLSLSCHYFLCDSKEYAQKIIDIISILDKGKVKINHSLVYFLPKLLYVSCLLFLINIFYSNYSFHKSVFILCKDKLDMIEYLQELLNSYKDVSTLKPIILQRMMDILTKDREFGVKNFGTGLNVNSTLPKLS